MSIIEIRKANRLAAMELGLNIAKKYNEEAYNAHRYPNDSLYTCAHINDESGNPKVDLTFEDVEMKNDTFGVKISIAPNFNLFLYNFRNRNVKAASFEEAIEKIEKYTKLIDEAIAEKRAEAAAKKIKSAEDEAKAKAFLAEVNDFLFDDLKLEIPEFNCGNFNKASIKMANGLTVELTKDATLTFNIAGADKSYNTAESAAKAVILLAKF